MQTTVVRIAIRLQLFHILVKSSSPVIGKELAEKTGTDHVLLRRILRYLVAMHAIDETGLDIYTANNVTKSLSTPELEAGINHTYDMIVTAAMALPSFLAKNKYQNPTDPKNCAFQAGFHTEDSLFEWFPKHPEQLNDFNLWMTVQRDGRTNWLDFFPFEERVAKDFIGVDNAVMLVDVGGACGHEIEAIKKRHPTLPGRFVLQDLADTIKHALPVPGMDAIAHDFLTAQPIKGRLPEPLNFQTLILISCLGARAYYIRNVLHDWPDDKCRLILSHLAAAMTSGYSKIILNELVLPNTGCGIVGAQIDIAMMAELAATERTERQWLELLDSAELKAEKIWTDVPKEVIIMEVVLK